MELTLTAEVRSETGTGAAHRLRRAGFVPAVIYSKEGAENLSLHDRDIERLVTHAGTGRLVTLHIKRGKKAEKTPVLIKEVQRNPVRGEIIHVDFHAVSLKQEITTHVPLHLVGEDKRLNDGAIIEQFLREVEVACLPTAIPDSFVIDISGLALGHSLHVADLTPPENVRINTPAEEIVVMAAAPHVAVETTEAEEAEAEAEEAQPEAAEGQEEE